MAADMERDDLLHLVLQFLRKENYKETLHSGDKKNALRILRDELNVFAVFDKVYFKETAHLMMLDNIREAPHLSNYVDTQTARASLLNKLKRLIIQNLLLRDKLLLPTLPEGSLHTKIHQSLNWQHLHCENTVEFPIIRTLFVDHACEQLNNINADQPPLSPVNDSPGVNNVNSSDNISNAVVANLSQGSSV
nr:topless-related protein 4-like [Ipomoea batatas]